MKQYKNIKFGVEIEFTGLHKRNAAILLSNYFESTYEQNAKSMEIIAKDNRTWKIVRDNSIMEEANEPIIEIDMYKNELVTPICTLNDLKTIKDLIKLLADNGAIVNDSCGLHVHVDANEQNPKSLANLLIFWINHQEMIVKCFKTNQRSLDKYCKLIPSIIKEQLLIMDDVTDEEFRLIWYQDYDDEPARYNKSRYQTMNLNSFYTIGTIEFRIGKGTLDFNYIKKYVLFCVLICKKAITDELLKEQRFNSFDEILNYL